MTFSIVARCASTGMFGVAVSSSSPAVAARCAHARAGIGAVASQNVTDPALGRRALDLMALGADAAEAVAVLRRTGGPMEYRQVLAVDAAGGSAIHSGPSDRARFGATHSGTSALTQSGAPASGSVAVRRAISSVVMAAGACESPSKLALRAPGVSPQSRMATARTRARGLSLPMAAA